MKKVIECVWAVMMFFPAVIVLALQSLGKKPSHKRNGK
jgi:hypothetical protein